MTHRDSPVGHHRPSATGDPPVSGGACRVVAAEVRLSRRLGRISAFSAISQSRCLNLHRMDPKRRVAAHQSAHAQQSTTAQQSTGRQLFNKVPEVTSYFWIIKILATTVGETIADYLTATLGFSLNNASITVGALHHPPP